MYSCIQCGCSIFRRVTKLMDTSKGRNVLSGSRDEGELYIAPAVYVDVDEDDSLMQEELFGPVLPIVTVQSMEEAIQFTNARLRKLGLSYNQLLSILNTL